jgi:outer membrane receptor protein involved in Fe transport
MRLPVALLLCCLCAGPLWSMEPPERQTQFDIRPQTLSGALRQFSSQSGMQVLAPDLRLADGQTGRVRGRMSATSALRRLLAGTGYAFRQVDAGTIVLLREETLQAQAQPGAPAPPIAGTADPAIAAGTAEVLEEVEEVQVTGTRIRGLGTHTAIAPMTTITSEEMRRLGLVNVADALTTLVPQNISTYMPALTGDNPTYTGNETGGTGGAGSGNAPFDRGSFFVGNTIANLRGMDPMFGSRTLTLVDGRRVVSTSNQADIVNLNAIPSNLLERMDVVTGGASATYGSGAMAGVVNLVLNRRLTGLSVDLDYGITDAGDGSSPHAAVSGGMPLFGGRGHMLLGLEWQKQAAIRDCAAARDWCAQSWALYQNYSGSAPAVGAPLVPLPGLEAEVARFRLGNVRYSQFAPTGTIYVNDAARTSGLRFSEDGTGIEEYAFGLRGGTGQNTVNGDGPVLSSGIALLPDTERRSVFANFEYELDPRVTAYVQGNFATTDSLNRNRYTQNSACVRFNAMGVAGVPGGAVAVGDVVTFGGNGEAFTDPFHANAPVPDIPRSPLWSNPNFRAFLGNQPNGRVPPYFIRPGQNGSTDTTPPTWSFTNAVQPVWQRITSAQGTQYWNLVSITMTAAFDDPGVPAVLPTLGRNAYAFLQRLSPEALYQVQSAFGNSPTTGAGNNALAALYGSSPCGGFTALRKVWTPQIQQWTEQDSDTWRAVAGLRGRIGEDWRWEAYYQYGATSSTSRQNNVQTNLSFAFAMDAVIDDRRTIDGQNNPAYNQPVCRVTRDGIPVLDSAGRPLSDPEGLAALAAGCRPLDIFGTSFATPQAAQLQRQALDYAFKENVSDGANSLQTLSLTATGTLWQGWAGPLNAAFGLEFREDAVDNKGSRGPFYERADISRAWGDAFGGRTRVGEGYVELNLPLAADRDGLASWIVNAGLRYGVYNNKGGAGTTHASATQDTPNWKFSTEFAPFQWVRLRLTRSRDLRAAGYRDLFLNQPGIPDQSSGVNLWRDRTADSDENQRERWGFVRAGNPNLKPERSDTLTLGLVLTPGGVAQGMNLAADYYSIRVRDAIYTPFNFESPVAACWQNSGNTPPRYVDGSIDPDQPGANGLFNPDLPECRAITFATNEDGSRDLHDIVSYNAGRPTNNLPYRRRGLDLSWNYLLPLHAAIPSLPGSVALTIRGTRALESSGVLQTCGSFTSIDGTFQCVDTFTKVELVGQVRSNVFVSGVSAAPKWVGNVIASYLHGGFTGTVSARYVGGAKLDNTWSDEPASPAYRNANNQLLYGSVDNNRIDPYLNFSLNGSYDLKVATLRQFQVFGSVNNLFDKSPPFTGGGISGASAQYHDTLGRAWRVGVRLKF